MTFRTETAATTHSLPAALDASAAWDWLAREVRAFAEREALELRELIVLLPFAQHLPLARAAWSRLGEASWLPRLETTQTLAAAAAPARELQDGALAFDAVADGLQAGRLLAAALPDWPRRDARGFDAALARLVETAHDLARARLALAPDQRAAWLEGARAKLAAAPGPGAQERALARLALEWSTSADATAADALHALAPAGWVALRAGAVDPLTSALLAGAAVPVLWLDAGLPADAAPPARAAVQLAACTDLEDEAQRSAAQVLAHLARGEQPVALIALDRVLLRRVRALLERQRVPISDETGWKLSTTRAGASIAGLLRAAQSRASTDELLDWLKSSPRVWPGLGALEAAWRRGAVSALQRVDAARLEAAAAALWQDWLLLSEPLRAARRLPLDAWLQRLRAALEQARLWHALQGDAAGAQVLDALRCTDGPQASKAWARQAAETRFDAAGFGQWVEAVLEQVAFRPPQAGAAPVVITPLARAMLRPFAAVVCPGADAAHLGAAPLPQPLLGNALAQALGLPGSAEQRSAEQQAFAQLLRAPRLSLLHRRLDGAEPLQPSALLLRLALAAQRAGRPLQAAPDERVPQSIVERPVARPLPSAPALLPDALNATAYEALRACPYRFFAERLLRLGEAEELDDAIDKRDYGTWLHAVLQDFHRRRGAEGKAAGDAELLRAIAAEQQALLARDDADFLPYALWFDRLAPRYLELLQREEAAGLAVRDTELALQARPAALAALGVQLRGQLDRLDVLGRDDTRRLRILDYKTSGNQRLRERLRQPLEDTQLPFYAALLAAAEQDLPPGGIEAAYLALDGREGAVLLPHAEVQASAAQLVEGIAADYERLRAGAALPALGEGSACEYCSARGLCRRDHWSDVEEAAP